MNVAVDLAARLCQHFEGFSAKPYRDPGTGDKPYTIGYGSTYYPDGRRVTLQDPPLTKEQAHAILLFELDHTFLPAVIRHCPGLIAEPPRRLAAILDWTYNLGPGRLQTATLKRSVNQACKDKDWSWPCQEIVKWNRANGKVLRGLVLRREAEAKLLGD